MKYNSSGYLWDQTLVFAALFRKFQGVWSSDLMTDLLIFVRFTVLFFFLKTMKSTKRGSELSLIAILVSKVIFSLLLYLTDVSVFLWFYLDPICKSGGKCFLTQYFGLSRHITLIILSKIGINSVLIFSILKTADSIIIWLH